MANLFDGFKTSEGTINLQKLTGSSSAPVNSIQNYTTPSLSQLANEQISKVYNEGRQQSFKLMTEAQTSLTASYPALSSLTGSLKFPTQSSLGLASAPNLNDIFGSLSDNDGNGGGIDQLNDILRAPDGSQLNAEQPTMDKYRVSLTSTLDDTRKVIFYTMPTIADSGTANYTALDVVHHPGSIQVYKQTASRTFQISGKFVSNTSEEASKHLSFVNLLRSWIMPFYGTGTQEEDETKSRFGAPPEILWFSAYGKFNFEKIPVAVTNYNFTYDDQSDYIPTAEFSGFGVPIEAGVPFPIVMTVSVSIIETYSPDEYGKFNLKAYREGDLIKAYGL